MGLKPNEKDDLNIKTLGEANSRLERSMRPPVRRDFPMNRALHEASIIAPFHSLLKILGFPTWK